MLNPVLRHADQAQKHARSAPWAEPGKPLNSISRPKIH
jgi:hypothetical protein